MAGERKRALAPPLRRQAGATHPKDGEDPIGRNGRNGRNGMRNGMEGKYCGDLQISAYNSLA